MDTESSRCADKGLQLFLPAVFGTSQRSDERNGILCPSRNNLIIVSSACQASTPLCYGTIDLVTSVCDGVFWHEWHLLI